MKKVGLIALGCAKNLVDAEVLLGFLRKDGYEICVELAECDVVIVHTCTFIDAAKTESIDAILEAADYKARKLKKLIVTGCIAERYKHEIMTSIPEVDAVLGSKSFDRIDQAIECDGKYEYYAPLTTPTPEGPRVLTSAPYSVYVKVADGCSNHCSYCVIPIVRGEFAARRFEDILEEVHTLADNGAKEINLVAQDTTRFPYLCDLIREICKIDRIKWVRVLYCYPSTITDELLVLMTEEPKFVKYIDVPLQHASGRILKLMNRKGDADTLLQQVEYIRRMVPEVSLRTTFITGFPKESEEDFAVLSDFVRHAKFNHVGVFPYSREGGTVAGRMHGQVPEEVRQQRADLIMTQQLTLLEQINRQYIGHIYDVLCEGKLDEQYTGRAYFQAPDVDGRIFFTSDIPVNAGEFMRVRIDRAERYDLYGKRVD